LGDKPFGHKCLGNMGRTYGWHALDILVTQHLRKQAWLAVAKHGGRVEASTVGDTLQ